MAEPYGIDIVDRLPDDVRAKIYAVISNSYKNIYNTESKTITFPKFTTDNVLITLTLYSLIYKHIKYNVLNDEEPSVVYKGITPDSVPLSVPAYAVSVETFRAFIKDLFNYILTFMDDYGIYKIDRKASLELNSSLVFSSVEEQSPTITVEKNDIIDINNKSDHPSATYIGDNTIVYLPVAVNMREAKSILPLPIMSSKGDAIAPSGGRILQVNFVFLFTEEEIQSKLQPLIAQSIMSPILPIECPFINDVINNIPQPIRSVPSYKIYRKETKDFNDYFMISNFAREETESVIFDKQTFEGYQRLRNEFFGNLKVSDGDYEEYVSSNINEVAKQYEENKNVTYKRNGISTNDRQIAIAIQGISVSTVPGVPNAYKIELSGEVTNLIPYGGNLQYFRTNSDVGKNIIREIIKDDRIDRLLDIKYDFYPGNSEPYKAYYKSYINKYMQLHGVKDRFINDTIEFRFAYTDDTDEVIAARIFQQKLVKLNALLEMSKYQSTELNKASTIDIAKNAIYDMTSYIKMFYKLLFNTGEIIQDNLNIILEDGTVYYNIGELIPPQYRSDINGKGMDKSFVSTENLLKFVTTGLTNDDGEINSDKFKRLIDRFYDVLKNTWYRRGSEVYAGLPEYKQFKIKMNTHYFEAIEMDMDGNETSVYKSNDITLPTFAARFNNKISTLGLLGFTNPIHQHLGRSSWSLTFAIQTSDPTVRKYIAMMQERNRQLINVQQMLEMKPKDKIQYITTETSGGVFDILGIRNIVISDVDYKSVPEAPGLIDITFNISETSIPFEKADIENIQDTTEDYVDLDSLNKFFGAMMNIAIDDFDKYINIDINDAYIMHLIAGKKLTKYTTKIIDVVFNALQNDNTLKYNNADGLRNDRQPSTTIQTYNTKVPKQLIYDAINEILDNNYKYLFESTIYGLYNNMSDEHINDIITSVGKNIQNMFEYVLSTHDKTDTFLHTLNKFKLKVTNNTKLASETIILLVTFFNTLLTNMKYSDYAKSHDNMFFNKLLEYIIKGHYDKIDFNVIQSAFVDDIINGKYNVVDAQTIFSAVVELMNSLHRDGYTDSLNVLGFKTYTVTNLNDFNDIKKSLIDIFRPLFIKLQPRGDESKRLDTYTYTLQLYNISVTKQIILKVSALVSNMNAILPQYISKYIKNPSVLLKKENTQYKFSEVANKYYEGNLDNITYFHYLKYKFAIRYDELTSYQANAENKYLEQIVEETLQKISELDISTAMNFISTAGVKLLTNKEIGTTEVILRFLRQTLGVFELYQMCKIVLNNPKIWYPFIKGLFVDYMTKRDSKLKDYKIVHDMVMIMESRRAGNDKIHRMYNSVDIPNELVSSYVPNKTYTDTFNSYTTIKPNYLTLLHPTFYLYPDQSVFEDDVYEFYSRFKRQTSLMSSYTLNAMSTLVDKIQDAIDDKLLANDSGNEQEKKKVVRKKIILQQLLNGSKNIVPFIPREY